MNFRLCACDSSSDRPTVMLPTACADMPAVAACVYGATATAGMSPTVAGSDWFWAEVCLQAATSHAVTLLVAVCVLIGAVVAVLIGVFWLPLPLPLPLPLALPLTLSGNAFARRVALAKPLRACLRHARWSWCAAWYFANSPCWNNVNITWW